MFFHFVHVTHVNIVFLTNEPRTQLNFFLRAELTFHFLGQIVTTAWVISVTWIGI